MKEIYYQIKWFFQRIFRGYSDPEWWDLDYALARWIIPRLEHLRKHSTGFPPDLGEHTWDNILMDMLLAFKVIKKYGRWSNEELVEKGLDQFRKYYFYLWD